MSETDKHFIICGCGEKLHAPLDINKGKCPKCGALIEIHPSSLIVSNVGNTDESNIDSNEF